MTDYSRKRCVVCGRTGGISFQADGIYECRNCGTPYRPRSRRAEAETTTHTHKQEAPAGDRFVWFTYADEEGTQRTGLYDCPVLAEHEQPVLHPNDNQLRFLRHLYHTGRLGSHTREE